MPNFAIWLAKQSNAEPVIKALQEFASANSDKWPTDSNSIEDYRKVVSDTASGPQRDDLLTKLGRLYERWFEQERKTFWGQLADNFSLIALFTGGLIIAVGLAYGIFFNKSFFDLMAQSDHARGLITFLFSFATIAIIVLVSIAVFWMDKSEVDARFAHAKDLISILVGVLGTVIGFYFGTASTSAEAQKTSSMTAAAYPTIPVNQISTQRMVSPQAPWLASVIICDEAKSLNERVPNETIIIVHGTSAVSNQDGRRWYQAVDGQPVGEPFTAQARCGIAGAVLGALR